MTVSDEKAGAWRSLGPWEKAKAWEKASPAIAEALMRIAEQELRHQRRLAWAETAMHVIGMLLGFGSVIVLALVAVDFARNGAALQGAAIFGVGTATTAAVFVTAARRRLLRTKLLLTR